MFQPLQQQCCEQIPGQQGAKQGGLFGFEEFAGAIIQVGEDSLVGDGGRGSRGNLLDSEDI